MEELKTILQDKLNSHILYRFQRGIDEIESTIGQEKIAHAKKIFSESGFLSKYLEVIGLIIEGSALTICQEEANIPKCDSNDSISKLEERQRKESMVEFTHTRNNILKGNSQHRYSEKSIPLSKEEPVSDEVGKNSFEEKGNKKSISSNRNRRRTTVILQEGKRKISMVIQKLKTANYILPTATKDISHYASIIKELHTKHEFEKPILNSVLRLLISGDPNLQDLLQEYKKELDSKETHDCITRLVSKQIKEQISDRSELSKFVLSDYFMILKKLEMITPSQETFFMHLYMEDNQRIFWIYECFLQNLDFFDFVENLEILEQSCSEKSQESTMLVIQCLSTCRIYRIEPISSASKIFN